MHSLDIGDIVEYTDGSGIAGVEYHISDVQNHQGNRAFQVEGTDYSHRYPIYEGEITLVRTANGETVAPAQERNSDVDGPVIVDGESNDADEAESDTGPGQDDSEGGASLVNDQEPTAESVEPESGSQPAKTVKAPRK